MGELVSGADRCLSVVLLEDVDFIELVGRIGSLFDACLVVVDKKGRYIAKGKGDNFFLEIVDRVDRLGDFLSDDNHVVDFYVASNFYPEFEDRVKLIFKCGKVRWKYAVWSKIDRHERLREIYPD